MTSPSGSLAIIRERQQRLDRFAELEPEDWVARGVTPERLRDRAGGFRIYGGQAGIYVDSSRTRRFAEPGVTVSVMHSGRDYGDEIRADHIIYDYPQTRRRGPHDRNEIEATKNARHLGMPIFVISQVGPLRDVYLSWVEGWEDRRRQFLITFATSSQPPVPFEESDPEWVKFTDRPVTTTEVQRRERDPRFAFSVFKRYGLACAVCGISAPYLVDAAHIIPVAAGGSHDPRNGLPLCATHHRAFDRDAFTINPYTLELVTLGVDSLADLRIPVDSLRHLPATPHEEALTWRWDRLQ